MTPERWERIKQVYHSALELEPGRRDVFLKEACAGDETLCKEVMSLLAQEGNSGEFFELPALQVVAKALAEDRAQEPSTDLVGHTLVARRCEPSSPVTNRLLSPVVDTYLEKPEDVVTLAVQMNSLPDGAIYAVQTTLEAKAKNITVAIQNSGYKPVTQ